MCHLLYADGALRIHLCLCEGPLNKLLLSLLF